MIDNKPKAVTMKDIAQQLGITTDAVSKALRDCRDISEKTKEKVRKVADELGYIPNNVAQSLRKGTTNTISLIFNDFYNPYFSVFLHKVYNNLNKKGYECQLTYCNTSLMNMSDVRNIMVNNFCGIISFVEPTNEVSNFFKNRQIPFTLIGIKSDYSNIDCIYTDDYSGGQQVAEYYNAGAFSNALYVSNSLSETSDRRMNGFKSSCIKPVQCIQYDDFSEEKAYNIIKDQKIDFLFCFSDSLALLMKAYLKKKRYQEKIKIIGFDNLHESYPFIQYIDSVGSNIDEIVEFACDYSIKKITNQISCDTKITKVFPTFLNIKK